MPGFKKKGFAFPTKTATEKPSDGKRITGFARYTEVLERNIKKFLLTNLMTLAGFLPFAFGVALALLYPSGDSVLPGAWFLYIYSNALLVVCPFSGMGNPCHLSLQSVLFTMFFSICWLQIILFEQPL